MKQTKKQNAVKVKTSRIIKEVMNEATLDIVAPGVESTTGWQVVNTGKGRYAIGTDKDGNRISHLGKRIGGTKKITPGSVKLTKSQARDLYTQLFDLRAPEMFKFLFELATTDKEMLKYAIDQRIGRPAQTIAGDETAPITLIVRRGSDQ